MTNDGTSPILMGAMIALLLGSAIFTFGHLKARMERANADYKKTKGDLPNLRKAFWRLWVSAFKVGFWVALVGFVLVMWVIRDAQAQP